MTAMFGDGVPKSEWQKKCRLLGEMDSLLEGPEHTAKANAPEGALTPEAQWETLLDNEADDVGEHAEEDREDTVVDGPPQEPDVSQYGRHCKKTQRYVEVMQAKSEHR
jgi:hypothetical protein